MKLLISALLIMATAPFAHAIKGIPSESRFAELDGMKVHYTNFGGAAATVVFVHGWSSDESVWREVASRLALKNVRAITIDLPGHGQSDKPEINYTMDLHARAINAVLEHAEVKKATLVGHSLGAASVRQFYRRFPEKVHALVIADGALRPFGDAAMMEKFLAPLRGPDFKEAIGAAFEGMTEKIKDSNTRSFIREMAVRTPQHVALSEMEATLNPELWKPDPINVPVLMIMAKSPRWDGDYEQFVRSFIPKLEYQVWDDVTHFLMLEKPNRFNAAVLVFMRDFLLLPELS